MILMATTKDETHISKLYGQECMLPKDEFLKKYNVNINGLSSTQANNLIHKYGFNEIRQARPKKWYNYFFESLFSPFNSILIGIMAILFYTDVYLPETPSYANIIVIAILVIAKASASLLAPSCAGLTYGYPFVMHLHTSTFDIYESTVTSYCISSSTPSNVLSIQYAGYSTPSFKYTTYAIPILTPFIAIGIISSFEYNRALSILNKAA